MDCASSDSDGSQTDYIKSEQLNTSAEAKHQPELSYSDSEIDHSKAVHRLGTASSIETVDNLPVEQEVDDVINKNNEPVPEDDNREIVSPCTVVQKHLSLPTETESSNEILPTSTRESEERDLHSQNESDQRENNSVKFPTSDDHNLEQDNRVKCPMSDDRNLELDNGTKHPTSDDRNLEQFSEVLLDSDSSLSDNEADADDITDNKKDGKRVRFADEVGASGTDAGSRLTERPPGSVLPLAGEPKLTDVPVNPSLTSPQQPVSPFQHTVDELIRGVEYPAKYLGSTPILLSGIGAIKSARMHQAQQAVKLIKDPESDCHPQFEVGIRISTKAVKIVDSKANIDLMEHPLHTISYVADIEGVLVIMAHLGPVLDPNSSPSTPDRVGVSEGSYTPKITCHVLDAENARQVARVIGQAFTAAYKEFLRSSGVTDETLEEAEYTHILNAQTIPQAEIETLSDRSKLKKITMAKSKGESLGIMVMEAGYGSAIPACVVAHMSKTGAALKSGLLNVGDHIISMNGVSLVGMPTKSCIEQIKKCRPLNVVRMVVCSIPAVVDITIVRPDLKYQLGFSVHEGMICSIIRGSIGERSGVRIGHRIIDINGTSTVNMSHQDVVHLLSCTVGDIRTMPDLMYKLLTGQVLPEYY